MTAQSLNIRGHYYIQMTTFASLILYTQLVQYVSLMIALCKCHVSGGLQSTLCHEEPFARSGNHPHREEESGFEREPVDTWTGPPGAPVKH